MTKLFDGYVAVDWSANGRPKQGKDSIWIAVRGVSDAEALDNPATRHEAVVRIEKLLREATAARRRLLIGFDFPFGYPAGTAKKLTGRDGWEAVWSRIAEVIQDDQRNVNNRFDAAALLNDAFKGDGPFWGNGLHRDILGLPRTKPPSGWGLNLPANLRHAESEVRSAQEVWKLNGAGSVGLAVRDARRGTVPRAGRNLPVADRTRSRARGEGRATGRCSGGGHPRPRRVGRAGAVSSRSESDAARRTRGGGSVPGDAGSVGLPAGCAEILDHAISRRPASSRTSSRSAGKRRVGSVDGRGRWPAS